MKRILNKVISFGLHAGQSNNEQRLIRTTNFLNLVVAFFLAIGFTNYFLLKSDFPLPAVASFFILALISLDLSRRGRTRAAFILFTLNVNLSIFFINEYYPLEAGAYLYYFPLIVSVVLLNSPSMKDRLFMSHLITSAVFFVASQLLEFPSLRLQNLTPEAAKALWYYDLFISVMITGVISILLTRLITRQNFEIREQNEDLIKAKESVNMSLKEKEVLLTELHHRVKNNLALISGLLSLQEEATGNEEAKRLISDSRTRIMSMAMVHRMLYENADLKRVSLSRYSSELIYELFNSYNLLKMVTIIEDYDEIILPVNKSIPLGLILNEIVTNSIKYVYTAGTADKGLFSISIKLLGDTDVIMTVKDNGSGFPEDYNYNSGTYSLGIYLIRTLAEQLEGRVRFSNDNGAKIELSFTR